MADKEWREVQVHNDNRAVDTDHPHSDEEEGGDDEESLLDKLNPFKAGQKLRSTLGTLTTSINLPAEKKSMYYLDDRLADVGGSESATITERNPLLDRLEQDLAMD